MPFLFPLACQASGRKNNIHKQACSVNNHARELNIVCKSVDDGKHNRIGLVEISKTFTRQDVLFDGTETSHGVYAWPWMYDGLRKCLMALYHDFISQGGDKLVNCLMFNVPISSRLEYWDKMMLVLPCDHRKRLHGFHLPVENNGNRKLQLNTWPLCARLYKQLFIRPLDNTNVV